MKSYIRSLAFRLGVKNAQTILSPIAKIVEDLNALSAHHDAEIATIGIQQQRLTQRKRELQSARLQTGAAAERVAQLIA